MVREFPGVDAACLPSWRAGKRAIGDRGDLDAAKRRYRANHAAKREAIGAVTSQHQLRSLTLQRTWQTDTLSPIVAAE